MAEKGELAALVAELEDLWRSIDGVMDGFSEAD